MHVPTRKQNPASLRKSCRSDDRRLTENGKRKMVHAGDDFQAALTALRNKEVEREYVKRGLDVPSFVGSDRPTIADAAALSLANSYGGSFAMLGSIVTLWFVRICRSPNRCALHDKEFLLLGGSSSVRDGRLIRRPATLREGNV